MKNLVWSCHVCGEERPDKFIGVVSGKLKGTSCGQINIRYCNDNTRCVHYAVKSAKAGRFPLSRKNLDFDKRMMKLQRASRFTDIMLVIFLILVLLIIFT